jgi:transposase InsO family protein
MHKNARLTPRGREILVSRLQSGQKPSEVAQAMGVSETTVRKWWRRFQVEGLAGLQDRSSCPKRSPRALPAECKQRIVALRLDRKTGRWIARQACVSTASVSRVLRRARLSRWREIDPQPPAQRYEMDQPGELIHIDTKKLGRIGSPGHRVTGRYDDRHRGIGWDFVHVAIDDHSRVSLAAVAPDETGASAIAFLEQVIAHFRQRGVQVKRVMTDNGSAYTSKVFTAACQRLQLRHVRTRPYTPRTNGKAERFIQSALREWAYGVTYQSSAQRTKALGAWLHHYNWHRPHTALHGQPPISRLGLSPNNLLKLHT